MFCSCMKHQILSFSVIAVDDIILFIDTEHSEITDVNNHFYLDYNEFAKA